MPSPSLSGGRKHTSPGSPNGRELHAHVVNRNNVFGNLYRTGGIGTGPPGLINNRRNIAESRVNQTSGTGAEQKHPATPAGELKYRAVKESGTCRELTIGTSQTITRLTGNILTDIKLDTAYQIIGVVKTHRLLNDLTGSRKDIIRLQG